MRRVAWRSLWAHRRRLASTLLAILLAVGFMSGTFILATTLDQAADHLPGSSSDLRFFQVLVSVFGVVALLVGAFVISNTFSILVTQRTRELALLRALGASRVQVFASVLLEAAVGAVASVAGLGLGRVVATTLASTMRRLGLLLPTHHLVVRPSAVALSLAMGMAATLLAALLPALRATRVPPLAALRDVAVDRAATSLLRSLAGLGLLGLGLFGCSAAWRGDGADASIGTSGAGAVLVVVGVILLSPVVIRTTIALPAAIVHRLGGLTGRLAMENAARSPRRTSTTASAVLISTALVVFVSVFAASAVESLRSDASRGFAGDFVVTGPGALTLPNGLLTSTMPPSVVAAVRRVPGVALAVGMGYSRGRISYPDGTTATPFVSSIDEAGLGTVLLPRMSRGRIQDLHDDGIVVDRVDARDHHLRLGDVLHYAVGAGPSVRLRLVGISDDPNLLGHATVTRARYAAVAPEVHDVQVGGTFARGADPEVVLQGVREAIAGTPNVWAATRAQFVGNLTHQISSFVNVIYALLALSVTISVLGIANTLSLTIHERTRELGLLRAVGMDRSGVRSSVRWEAVVVGAFGMTAGLGVGAVVSVAMVKSLRDLGLVSFVLPLVAVALIAAGAVLLTFLALLRPAHRASAVSILDAIGAE